jgi:hypothetical protein
MRSAQLAGLSGAGIFRRVCVIAIQESNNAQIGKHYHGRLHSPASWALQGLTAADAAVREHADLNESSTRVRMGSSKIEFADVTR